MDRHDGWDDGEAERFLTQSAGERLAIIAQSFTRLPGRALAGQATSSASALWGAPCVILAHGLEPDPLFFYGNRLALAVFELTPQQLVRTPSRLSAEPGERAERARLMEQVSRRGVIDDYAGVRISATGRRFRIEQATVWNLLDDIGRLHGQAAVFDAWTPLGEAGDARAGQSPGG